MDTKSSLVIGGSVVVASVVLSLLLALKPPATPHGQAVGRFQMSGVPGHAYVIDTTTGQVWEDFAPVGQGSNDQGFKQPKPK